MAADIFLKIKGIDGESKDKTHSKQIEIQSFSWGVSNPSSVGHGTGMGTGKATISSINFMKEMDMSSCKLFLKCCQGDHIDEAFLYVRKSGGSEPLEYYKLTVKEVFVDSMQWTGAEGGGQIHESFSLSFNDINVDYISQTEKGGKGDPDKASWNVKLNAST